MERVLVTGAAGLLGGALLRAAPPAVALLAQTRRVRLPADLAARTTEIVLELRDPAAVGRLFAAHRPTAVIHTAARTVPADCEAHPDEAAADNVAVTALLARECGARGLPLVHCSTDLVFDGRAAPYAEEAPPCPVSVYGRTKADAEAAALGHSGALVARLPLLYGASLFGRRSVEESLAGALARGETPACFVDEFRTPLHVHQAAALLWALLAHGATGRLHVAGRDRVSRYELAAALVTRLGLSPERLRPASLRDFTGTPPRCPDVSLVVTRLEALLGRPAPGLAEGLALPLGGAPAVPAGAP